MLSCEPIGFQRAWLPDGPKEYQLRFFCEVEPLGDFENDPDGDITKIKFIEPKDYKQYFDWGEVGDRIMERVFEKMEKE